MTPSPLVFISAAEPSADRHGASLIRATRAICPDVRFVGVAGPQMREAGCDSIYDMTRHSAMLLGALRVVRQGMEMLSTAGKHLRQHPFDAAVVIDSPVLHLPLAKRAHAAGVGVLYYIAPQLWAWAPRRIRKLRRSVERMAVILPFEEEYFRSRGMDATFVGHPLAEQFLEATCDDAKVESIRAGGTPMVALLPGSRKHVVSEVLRGQLEVARKISEVYPEATFGVSVANEQVSPIVDELLTGVDLPIQAYGDHYVELIRAADLVLVASGTTTLELALYNKPMIVMYNASRLFYHAFGRWVVRTPHLSLPNILAQRRIVPEFMPYYTSTDPIAETALELLSNPSRREAMVEDLERVVAPLRETQAAKNTAMMLLEMVKRRRA